jgi:hypothetical protein
VAAVVVSVLLFCKSVYRWRGKLGWSKKFTVIFGALQDLVKRETRFTSKRPAKEIISTIEEAAKPLGFNVQKRDYKMKLQGDKHGRKGHLSVATEVSTLSLPFLCTIYLSLFLKTAYLIELTSFPDYSTRIGCDFAGRCLRLHHLFTWWNCGNPMVIHWNITM